MNGLTDRERRALASLQKKWATGRASLRQIMRCRELEHKEAHYIAEQAADSAYGRTCLRAGEGASMTDLADLARSILLAPFLRREPCPVCCEAGFTVDARGMPNGPCATCAGKGYVLVEAPK